MTDVDPARSDEAATPNQPPAVPAGGPDVPVMSAGGPDLPVMSADEPDTPVVPAATTDATALTALSDRADEGWRRLSVRMLLVHPIQELRRAIIPLLVLIVFGRGDRNLWPYAAVLIVIALGLIRWFTTTYRVTPTQIQVRRGLLGRSTLSVPRDRVRTVDVTSHLMHRVLGLARITIGTGQTDRKKRTAFDSTHSPPRRPYACATNCCTRGAAPRRAAPAATVRATVQSTARPGRRGVGLSPGSIRPGYAMRRSRCPDSSRSACSPVSWPTSSIRHM